MDAGDRVTTLVQKKVFSKLSKLKKKGDYRKDQAQQILTYLNIYYKNELEVKTQKKCQDLLYVISLFFRVVGRVFIVWF